MSSFKLSPFTSLGASGSIAKDDFVYDTLETYKLKGSTTNGGKLDYKIKINREKGQLAYSDEGKIQFPVFDTYTVQLGRRGKGNQLRLHVDLGDHLLAGKKWNFFTNLKTTNELREFNIRLGTNYFGQACESNTRVEIVPNVSTVLTHRNSVRRGDFQYGLVGSLNLSTFALIRYNAFLSYANSKYNVQLKHESTSADKVALGKVVSNATYTHDADTKVGAEVVTEGQKLKSVVLAAQRKCCDKLTVKGSVSNSADLSFAAKYSLNKQITLTSALKLALKSKNVVDFSTFPPLPLGLQVDINV